MSGHSQFGEDEWLWEHLQGIDRGYAAEVGAVDGVYLSTTKLFEERGWTVLCIEPNPFYLPALYSNRSLVMPYACSSAARELAPFVVYDPGWGDFTAGSGLEGIPEATLLRKGVLPPKERHRFKIPVRTLDWCLEQADFPRLDLLTIDTEGNDLAVLRGFDIGRWKPKIVMHENWRLPEQDFDSYFKAAGYTLFGHISVNDVYIREEAMDGRSGGSE